MAKRPSYSLFLSPLSPLLLPRGDTCFYLIAILSILSLLIHHLSLSSLAADHSHFEGFDADDDGETLESESLHVTDIPPRSSPLLTLTQSDPNPPSKSQPSDLLPKPSETSFDFWDDDEFEGLPEESPTETTKFTQNATPADSDSNSDSGTGPTSKNVNVRRSYTVEIVCGSFLIMFAINYFTGKKENENIALSWATKFATKDSIFEKNFSLLGVGDGDDSPLLLKEGQNVFKFYASGRRFCQGLVATMELQSRHDLISRLYNMIVPCKDEITLEVSMNDDAMDNVVFALVKKKAAKSMQKEVRDLQRFAGLVAPPPSNRKWVKEDLSVISESKEVAGDLITETVLDQVFGEKAFDKFGKGFISMHFSDQHLGTNKKMLVFKFALPDAKNMTDMTRLVALVPYYIDLIGRYKLSSQARSKTEAARLKVAQEAFKELQNVRQETLQKRKAERKKIMEEAEAKLSAEAIRKKEAKGRARQMKKAMPKVKMTRGH